MERNSQCKLLKYNVCIGQDWMGHGSAPATLWLVPSARARHSTRAGELYRAEGGRGRAAPPAAPPGAVLYGTGSGAATRLPASTPPPHLVLAGPKAFYRGEQSSKRDAPPLATRRCFVLAPGSRDPQARGTQRVPSTSRITSTSGPLPAPRGALSRGRCASFSLSLHSHPP